MKTLKRFSFSLILLMGVACLQAPGLLAQKWSGESYSIQKSGSGFLLNGKTCISIGAEIYKCSGDEFFFVKKDRKQIILLRGGDLNKKISLTQQVVSQTSKSSTTTASHSSSSTPKNTTKTTNITEEVAKPDINALGADGQTQLHAAIKSGDSKKVQELIGKGASVKVKNSQNELPLDLAVRQKNANMVKTLVAAKAIPSNTNGNHPAFVKAIQSQDKALVNAFFEGGYKIRGNTNYIEEALNTDNTEIVQSLVEQDVDVSAGLRQVTAEGNYELFKLLMKSESGTQLTRSTFQDGLNNFPADQQQEYTALALDKGMHKGEALAVTLNADNLELTELILNKGGDVGTAMNYGISRKNYTLIETCIDNHSGNVDLPLTSAIDSRDMRMASLSLDRGARPDNHVANAAGKGSNEVLRLLLDRNGNANLGMMPAIENSNQSTFELLISRGAEVDKDQYLAKIVDIGAERMVRTLLDSQKEVLGEAKPDPGMLPGIQNGNEQMVAMLIDEYGADATPSAYIRYATKSNQLGITKKLVENGADSQVGLIHAIEGNFVNIAEYLIDNKADASADRYMEAATATDNREMVQLMLDEGGDPEVGMILAVNTGKSNSASTLLNGGADASNQDYLITAVNRSYSKIVSLLLAKGTDPVFVDSRTGRTLLHVACSKGSLATSDHLIQAGNDVNAKDMMGNTPLHLAVPIGKEVLDLVKLLIAAGADVNASNKKGEKILKVATGKGKVKKTLKDAGAKRK